MEFNWFIIYEWSTVHVFTYKLSLGFGLFWECLVVEKNEELILKGVQSRQLYTCKYTCIYTCSSYQLSGTISRQTWNKSIWWNTLMITNLFKTFYQKQTNLMVIFGMFEVYVIIVHFNMLHAIYISVIAHFDSLFLWWHHNIIMMHLVVASFLIEIKILEWFLLPLRLSIIIIIWWIKRNFLFSNNGFIPNNECNNTWLL